VHEIRVATPDEYPLLRRIEEESDQLFESVGIGPFENQEEENHLSRAALVLVSGQPAVGFACVEIVDGLAHLWQVSVLPSAGHQGRGRALVEAVCDWAAGNGYPGVTLTTFRDVPWNGPFYTRLGFRVVDELSPGLAALRQHERDIGDDDWGPRVAMRKEVATKENDPESP
jgi:GNAT superfamily N-acetyltransferase